MNKITITPLPFDVLHCDTNAEPFLSHHAHSRRERSVFTPFEILYTAQSNREQACSVGPVRANQLLNSPQCYIRGQSRSRYY